MLSLFKTIQKQDSLRFNIFTQLLLLWEPVQVVFDFFWIATIPVMRVTKDHLHRLFLITSFMFFFLFVKIHWFLLVRADGILKKQ